MKSPFLIKQPIRVRSLQLHDIWRSAIAKGLALFFAVLIVLVPTVELLGKSRLAFVLPPPSTGTGDFLFDAKVQFLEEEARENDRLDCLIVGSSIALENIDPGAMEQEYARRTGSRIHCFNFGLPGITWNTTGRLAQALAHRFHPRLVIGLVTPRDFSTEYETFNAGIIETEWIKYNLGSPSLQGWLVNYSYVYRYLLLYRYALLPDFSQKFVACPDDITPLGYCPLFGKRADISPSPPGPIDKNFAYSEEVLAPVIDLNRTGTGVVFIEAPISPSYLPVYFQNGPEGYEQNFIAPLSATLRDQDITLLLTNAFSREVPESEWWDLLHLNSEGANRFSIWIADELADRCLLGQDQKDR